MHLSAAGMRKERGTVFLQHVQQKSAEYSGADNFAGSHGQHHVPECVRDAIGEAEYRRDNQHIGKNGRQRDQMLMLPQKGCGKHAEKRCQCSENNIRQRGTQKKVR